MKIELFKQPVVTNTFTGPNSNNLKIKTNSQPVKDTVQFKSIVVDETVKRAVPSGWTRLQWNIHILKETAKYRQYLLDQGSKDIPQFDRLFSVVNKVLSVIEEYQNTFL